MGQGRRLEPGMGWGRRLEPSLWSGLPSEGPPRLGSAYRCCYLGSRSECFRPGERETWRALKATGKEGRAASPGNLTTARVATSRYPREVLVPPGHSNNALVKESVFPLHLALWLTQPAVDTKHENQRFVISSALCRRDTLVQTSGMRYKALEREIFILRNVCYMKTSNMSSLNTFIDSS